jgi:cytochrome c-type biogenesis protein CcmF
VIIGIVAISTAFVAVLISTAGYILFYKFRDEKIFKLANSFFYLSGGLVVFSLVLLCYSIMTHNFQLNYVYSYSSRSLNKFYLFSTLWAGQEGTFLLWLFYNIIFGIILIKTVGRQNPLVLLAVMLVQGYTFLILLEKNPFAAIWHVHSEVPIGFTPKDGAGLNPLLQNPWMVIHPPTLFVGYSSTIAAFAFAINGLITKDFQGWIKKARPWVIFNVMILITGIVMGGYWAYATLGWGGYWAWDPVENASLVPWLFSAALLHGIVIQTRRKALVRSNFLLAGLAFLSVLWGSYLTRSGVLTDFSVHSFAASGLSLYLLFFVILFSLFFILIFAKNIRGLKAPKFGEGFLNRESFILIGMSTFILLGVIVLVGTASPIYTGLIAEPASVGPTFYNFTSLPISVMMLIAVSLAPLLGWNVSELREKNLILKSAIISLFLTIISVLLGLSNFASIILFFLAACVIIINITVSYNIFRKNLPKAGGFIAHIGLGFMVIGILTSSIYDTSEKLILPTGDFQKSKFGYEIQFTGFIDRPNGKDVAKLIVKTDYGTYEAYPQFYFSEYSKSYMASPDVREGITKDIYISPISFTPANMGSVKEIELGKNETTQFADLKITFNNFIVDMASGQPKVTADLNASINKSGYDEDYHLQPVLRSENGKFTRKLLNIGDTGYRIQINRVNASSGKVWLEIISPNSDASEARDMLAVEVSEKPLISVLWIGTLVLVFGTFLTLLKHTKRKNLTD